MGGVLLDVTVADRGTASVIRAAIEAVMPADGRSRVDLFSPPEPPPGSPPVDYGLRGLVVIDGLSDSEAADVVEPALAQLPEVDYYRSDAATGVPAFVVARYDLRPIWTVETVCATWGGRFDAALPRGVQRDRNARGAIRAPHLAEGHIGVVLAVWGPTDAPGARKRASEALTAANVGSFKITRVSRRR